MSSTVAMQTAGLTERQQLAYLLRATETSAAAGKENMPAAGGPATSNDKPPVGASAEPSDSKGSVAAGAAATRRRGKAGRKTKAKKQKRQVFKHRAIWRPSAYDRWSMDQQYLWDRVPQDPNAYYYRYPAPGEKLRTSRWTDAELETFRHMRRTHPTKNTWGLFSMHIMGRTGYQCEELAKSLKKRQALPSHVPPRAPLSGKELAKRKRAAAARRSWKELAPLPKADSGAASPAMPPPSATTSGTPNLPASGGRTTRRRRFQRTPTAAATEPVFEQTPPVRNSATSSTAPRANPERQSKRVLRSSAAANIPPPHAKQIDDDMDKAEATAIADTLRPKRLFGQSQRSSTRTLKRKPQEKKRLRGAETATEAPTLDQEEVIVSVPLGPLPKRPRTVKELDCSYIPKPKDLFYSSLAVNASMDQRRAIERAAASPNALPLPAEMSADRREAETARLRRVLDIQLKRIEQFWNGQLRAYRSTMSNADRKLAEKEMRAEKKMAVSKYSLAISCL